MGKSETEEYALGSLQMARALDELTRLKGALTVVCGGDTVAFVDHQNQILARVGAGQLSYSHLSTGGGAALEFLQGDLLPGLEALNDKSGK